MTIPVLALSSLVFYAAWDWTYLWVIATSITFNYLCGQLISTIEEVKKRKFVLTFSIMTNLLLLGCFKYTNFVVDNVSSLAGQRVSCVDIILPLGISFFTFQQIAYLVDVYRREAVEHRFHHYVLFVSFFPQLIAGPIVHHKEMMPQFVAGNAGLFRTDWVSLGVAVFSVGVAKKVLIADTIASYAGPVFDAAAVGTAIPLIEAWGGTLAYTFQIYFDFSAYSDMAIGLGLIFGIRLPINFNSPYKAGSLIDFWRRWHITLSRFLRDYLYIPLGGNRKGNFRRYLNLLLVMLLGGLWHGAGWTFIIWGGLHGFGLLTNHAWRRAFPVNNGNGTRRVLWHAASVCVTFLFVSVTWVFFRSADIGTAMNVLSGMAGLNGVVIPDVYAPYLGSLGPWLVQFGVRFETVVLFQGFQQLLWIAVLLLIVMFCPNTLNWAGYNPIQDADLRRANRNTLLSWRPTFAWSIALAGLSLLSLMLMSDAGDFLYYQF